MRRRPTGAIVVAALFASCGGAAKLQASAGFGPDPVLPPPETSLVPTVKLAVPEGWQPGQAPEPAAGLTVTRFAAGLDHPRWLYVLPDGGVLVAETNAPQDRPDDAKSFKGLAMHFVLKRLGSNNPSADRITLLAPTGRENRHR